MAANAGPDQPDVGSLVTVTLAGSGATDGVYTWRQVSGPAVTLSSTTVPAPTFQSPATFDGAALVFGLTVDATPSAEDTVGISVRPHQMWARSGGVWRPVVSYA